MDALELAARMIACGPNETLKAATVKQIEAGLPLALAVTSKMAREAGCLANRRGDPLVWLAWLISEERDSLMAALAREANLRKLWGDQTLANQLGSFAATV